MRIFSNMWNECERMNADVILINIYILFNTVHQNLKAPLSLNLKNMWSKSDNNWHLEFLNLRLLCFFFFFNLLEVIFDFVNGGS